MTAPANDNATRADHGEPLRFLAERPVGGYGAGGPDAAEPTAWATIALAAAGRHDAARHGADWLAALQAADGAVGVTADDPAPGWPTALAMLAWDAVDRDAYADRIAAGAAWALAQAPWTQPRNGTLGHDTELEGWSWAPATHSWLEPTAFFVLALRRAERTVSDRRRQGVRLLVDRLLPDGGANYGNTIVLGQQLLQHVQPSGIVALALAAEETDDPRLPKTLDYLQRAAAEPTGVASLAYAVLGLAASRRPVESFAGPLAEAWPRAVDAGGVYKPALVALATLAVADPDNALAFARSPAL